MQAKLLTLCFISEVLSEKGTFFQSLLNNLTAEEQATYNSLIYAKNAINENSSAPEWYTGSYDWVVDYLDTYAADLITGGAKRTAIVDALIDMADLDSQRVKFPVIFYCKTWQILLQLIVCLIYRRLCYENKAKNIEISL